MVKIFMTYLLYIKLLREMNVPKGCNYERRSMDNLIPIKVLLAKALPGFGQSVENFLW